MSLSEALPTTAIDIVSKFTRRSATGNCERRTCSRSLRRGYSGIHSFIHSFIHSAISIAPLQVLYYSEAPLPTVQHGYCIGVSRRSAQATAGKGLAQGPYMAARAGVEPTTLRLKAIDSTKAPPCPTMDMNQRPFKRKATNLPMSH